MDKLGKSVLFKTLLRMSCQYAHLFKTFFLKFSWSTLVKKEYRCILPFNFCGELKTAPL